MSIALIMAEIFQEALRFRHETPTGEGERVTLADGRSGGGESGRVEVLQKDLVMRASWNVVYVEKALEPRGDRLADQSGDARLLGSCDTSESTVDQALAIG